eukprot:3218654-Rhodomonas_salina.2
MGEKSGEQARKERGSGVRTDRKATSCVALRGKVTLGTGLDLNQNVRLTWKFHMLGQYRTGGEPVQIPGTNCAYCAEQARTGCCAAIGQRGAEDALFFSTTVKIELCSYRTVHRTAVGR